MSGKGSIQTTIQEVECDQVWKVDNFDKMSGNDWVLSSCTFSSGNNNNKLEWRMKLSCKRGGFYKVYLNLEMVTQNRNLRIDAWVSVLSEEGTKIGGCVEKSINFGMEGPQGSYESLLLALGKKDDLIPKIKKLKIELKIMYSEIETKVESDDEQQLQLDSQLLLSNNFGALLEDGNLSDVTIRVTDDADVREFKCHKNILSARSAVFAAMFRHVYRTRENSKNRVEIRELDPNAVAGMLEYIYTGRVSNLNQLEMKVLTDLLVSGDRYALDELKTLAERRFLHQQIISVQDAPRLLAFADLHSAEKLKNRVTHFIKENLEEVMKTQDWNSVIVANPNLLSLVLMKLRN